MPKEVDYKKIVKKVQQDSRIPLPKKVVSHIIWFFFKKLYQIIEKGNDRILLAKSDIVMIYEGYDPDEKCMEYFDLDEVNGLTRKQRSMLKEPKRRYKRATKVS